MTIDEAIKNGEQYLRDGEPHDLGDFEEFVQLGIEALKRIKEAREQHLIRNDSPLPGETEK